MEPTKEAINVRLARLTSQFLGHKNIPGNYVHLFKKSLNKDGLLDALIVLYDECNNDTLKKSDDQIAKFVEKYRCVLTELKRLRVNINDFEVKDIIGRGHFGEVHVVREKHTGDVFAMKTLRKDATLKQKDVTFYEEERDIMAHSKSDWIIKLQYAFQDSAQLYLVMEFCPGGDLAGLLDRRGEPLNEKDALFYIAELNQAINTLHTMGYVHRDVKPDNVLLDRCGHLKLGDFGSSARILQSGYVNTAVPVGTPDYIAPELLQGMETSTVNTHGTPCDYWSLGIVAYELVSMRTPFSDHNKSISMTKTYNNIMQFAAGVGSVSYPEECACVSTEYRDMVSRLLNVDVKVRYGFLDMKRHKAFKDIHWNSIRDMVPPIVPVVASVDDTSNFVEYAKQTTKPSLDSFLRRDQFTGRNLPFIGFTFSQEQVCPSSRSSLCLQEESVSSGCDGEAFLDTQSCAKHTHSSSSGDAHTHNGYHTSSSFNGTAINMVNVREMENLLESRKREIEALQSRVAGSEMESYLMADKERRLQDLDEERTRLEHEVTQLIVQNQKLTRQLEQEHEERKDLETKSLELINCAKDKWFKKTRTQLDTLNGSIAVYNARQKELLQDKEIMQAKLNAVTIELDNVRAEMECMKKLQTNYKEVSRMVHELKHRRFSEINIRAIDSMSKARKLSRQSIVGMEQMSADSSSQIQSLTERLNRESQAKRQLQEELEALQADLADAGAREARLAAQLEALDNDHQQLKVQCKELESLRMSIQKLETEKQMQQRKMAQMESARDKDAQQMKEAAQRHTEQTAAARNQIQELEQLVCDWMAKAEEARVNAASESVVTRLQGELRRARDQLEDAQRSDERHKDKVAELEILSMRLEQEVSQLEMKENPKTVERSGEAAVAEGKLSLLREQVARLEDQLKVAREEALLAKQEARTSNTKLWKKEKELSECDLDKRIATRELKQAEDKIKKLTEEKKSLADSYSTSKSKLEEKIAEQGDVIVKLRDELVMAEQSLERAEKALLDSEERANVEKSREQRLDAEIDRYKNDIRKMKCELQYSESRRLKAEGEIGGVRAQLAAAEAAGRGAREEGAALRATLHERNLQADNLATNNKMLQDACTLLEEQLLDFEKLSQVQENKTRAMENETAEMRRRLSECHQQLVEHQHEAEAQRQLVKVARIQLEQAQEQHTHTEKALIDAEKRLDEQRSKIAQLSEEVSAGRASAAQSEAGLAAHERRARAAREESAALKEECSALLTRIHTLKEEAMTLALQLREAEGAGLSWRREAEESRAEVARLEAHHRQRQLTHDATLHQHTKLIDFLQAKVEESSRRKKGLGNLLFGRGGPPPTPPAPAAPLAFTRQLQQERQANRMLRDEIARLKHGKGDPNEAVTNNSESDFCLPTSTTPVSGKRCSQAAQRGDVMEGWIRIGKGQCLERVYLVLSGHTLTWYNCQPSTESALSLGSLSLQPETGQPPTLSHAPDDAACREPALSPLDRRHAFVIGISSHHLLFVCSSEHTKECWLSRLRGVMCDGVPSEDICHTDAYVPTEKIYFSHNSSIRPLCLLEVQPGIHLIGAEDGLYSCVGGACVRVCVSAGVREARVLDACAVFASESHVSWCHTRQLCSVTQRHSVLQPQLALQDVTLPHQHPPTTFELGKSEGRLLLCVASSRCVVLLHMDPGLAHAPNFQTVRRVELPHVHAVLLAPHSLLLAAHTLLELDLSNFTLDQFLDDSDPTLHPAVYAHKNNSYPRAILGIDTGDKRATAEYLVCYRDYGCFVDEFGRRSRSEDARWKSAPVDFAFRKPFLFVTHRASVTVYRVDEKAFKSPPCECDGETASVSTVSVAPDCLTIALETPKILGKSHNQGAVYIGTVRDEISSIVELNGYDAFKKDLGLSIETLNTLEDNDSCKNSDMETYRLPAESDTDSLADSVTECRTAFAEHIRQRAKQINTSKQGTNNQQIIQNILQKESTNFTPKGARIDPERSENESEFDSSEEGDTDVSTGQEMVNNMYTNYANKLRENSARRTDASHRAQAQVSLEICGDSKDGLRKQVRFGKENN